MLYHTNIVTEYYRTESEKRFSISRALHYSMKITQNIHSNYVICIEIKKKLLIVEYILRLHIIYNVNLKRNK